MAFIAFLIAVGGKRLLLVLGEHRLWGALLAAGLVLAALGSLRRAHDPSAADVRVNVTRAAAYVCASALALWAVLAPASWVFGACIVAAEVALVFDIVTVAARGRVAGGN